MNVAYTHTDELNATLTISIEQKDYQVKVDNQLKDYKKKANIPGFRPGMAPLGLIKKQYENGLRFEEINKILHKELFDFLAKEKIKYLGQPIPQPKDNIDWNAQTIDFDFTLGLAPTFDIDLTKAKINSYKVEASNEDINEVIKRLLNENGVAEDSEEIEENSFFTITINEINTEIPTLKDKSATLFINKLKNSEEFLGKRLGDKITISAQNIFADRHSLQHILGLNHEQAHHFNGELELEITTIKTTIPAVLDVNFFAKIFPSDEFTKEEDFTKKLKEELEKQYAKDSKMFFMNETTDWLVKNISFNLPKEFLINFFKTSGENIITEEEARIEYEKSKKGIKYQLIEEKIIKDNNIQIEANDIHNFAKESLKNQLSYYGYKDITEEELDKFAKESLQNKEQIKKYNAEIIKEKLFNIFNEKISKKEIKVSYKEFIKIIGSKEEI